MKSVINDFKAVSFLTRKELTVEEKVKLMNDVLTLKLTIARRLEDAGKEAYEIARKSPDRFACFKIDARIRELVDNEWMERINTEIMGDRLWFDQTVMIKMINYALSMTNGIHVEGFNHFVVAKNEIRIFAARMF
jgi:hypothetical protein